MADSTQKGVKPAYTPQTEPIPDDGKPFVPALLVIDMQNDFVYGSLAVPGASNIINRVNQLIDLPFTTKVATRDYHPDNHVSFAKTHQQEPFSRIIIYHPDDRDELKGLEQVLWPVHCVAKTVGADFVPGLTQTKFEKTIFKGTHRKVESYSAFRDAWARDESELPGHLAEHGITDVFCVGLAGDFCVKYTALDAVDYGYRTWVVVDCVKSISQDEVAWDKLKSAGVHFTTSEFVKKRIA
ncbi:pyrazinamidase/nicotinamidase [Ephemerocybe angulata]|uniref:nicotinamidase n=1 Tax=Ephemerocybe angulata TaxID=980116 RepID=A0A8H6MES6_9AGAR|nr:pyrazinamidase/nicotinamidase [Tulosesus angulatus]